MFKRGDYVDTTERVDPTTAYRSAGDFLVYLFHIAAYQFASDRAAQMSVLDFGTGTGYGAHFLSTSASSVVGVDVSESAITFASKRFQRPNLRYQLIKPVDDEPLPFDDSSFDVVVSFQVIEHVPEPAAYLAEAARVLRPGGLFLCVTPDRTTRLRASQKPWNRWHVDEFTSSSLRAMTEDHFVVESLMGMSAPDDVLRIELARCRRQSFLTLPFTFRRAPEWWRLFGLTALGYAKRASTRLKHRGASPSVTREQAEETYGFGLPDIEIATDASPSTNVVLLARPR